VGEEELALFESQVRQMTLYLEEVPARLDAIEQRVESAAQWFPLVVGMVRDLLAQLRATITKFLEEVAHVIESHTPFVSLILRAFEWLGDVQQPVSNLVATADQTLGNENLGKWGRAGEWGGEAAAKYDEKRDQQATALRAVAERATFVHDWLVEILRANIAYTTKVVQQLTTLATEIVPIISKAAIPVTAASAVGDLKELVVTVVEHRVQEYSDIFERLGQAIEWTGEVAKKMSDHETFPEGAWPQAVA
jgi:hypothetical protein